MVCAHLYSCDQIQISCSSLVHAIPQWCMILPNKMTQRTRFAESSLMIHFIFSKCHQHGRWTGAPVKHSSVYFRHGNTSSIHYTAKIAFACCIPTMTFHLFCHSQCVQVLTVFIAVEGTQSWRERRVERRAKGGWRMGGGIVSVSLKALCR